MTKFRYDMPQDSRDACHDRRSGAVHQFLTDDAVALLDAPGMEQISEYGTSIDRLVAGCSRSAPRPCVRTRLPAPHIGPVAVERRKVRHSPGKG